MKAVFHKIITFFLLAALGAIIMLGFFWLRTKLQSSLSTRQAVPPDFAFCLETRNFFPLNAALQNYNNIWSEFLSYDELNTVNNELHIIDSLGRKYSDLTNLLKHGLIVSVHPGGERFSSLFVLNSSDHRATEQLLKLVSNETEIKKEKFEGITLYHLDFKESFPNELYFFETRGIVVFSTSKDLLLRSVRHIAGGENTFDKDPYSKISGTVGSDVEAHVFVNFNYLEQFISTFLKQKFVPAVSRFTSAAALDLEIRQDQLILNGFSQPNDSLYQKVKLFTGQKAVSQELFGYMPSDVVFFQWIGLSDPVLFRARMDMFFPEGGEIRKFRSDFFKVFGGQAALLKLRMSTEKFSDFFILSLKSRGLADDFLRKNLFALSTSHKIISKTIRITKDYETEIYSFPLQNLTRILFGDIFSEKRFRYFSFFDNNLIMSESEEDLEKYLYMCTLGQTVENSVYFAGFRQDVSSRSNFAFYYDPVRHFNEGVQFLRLPYTKAVNDNTSSWKKISYAGFQSTVADDLSYFRLFLRYSGEIREYVNTVWERKLEANSVIKPAIVRNHITGEKEIFIQDEDNRIYLISNNGGIIWSQEVDGPVLSEIIQIDYYNNNRLQYLFNTPGYIYLIDRNGNKVENFPVKLRETASAGLAVFDYENNGKLRIPVPTTGKDILMYDRDGNIVSGWKFRQTDHIVSFPLRHVRIEDRDYIIVHDKFRLYFLDRRGRERLKPKKQIEFSAENDVYFIGRNSLKDSRIIASSRKGEVFEFYFNGEVKKILTAKTGPAHFFLPEDIVGSRQQEFIFADSSNLLVYNEEGKMVLSEKLPDNVSHKPVVYTFALTDKKIGIVTENSERIYLINNDGSIYQGFPLRGSTLFSISSFPGLKDRFNLIVGNNDNFLYNYSVK